MLNSRSRKLTVVLAAGALTMFGAAGAFAAEEGPGGGGGGGDGGGGGNPLCAGTPLAATPLRTAGPAAPVRVAVVAAARRAPSCRPQRPRWRRWRRWRQQPAVRRYALAARLCAHRPAAPR